jgi:1A family penicillin-binding protein
MARSRRKKPALFYEALTLAPGMPGFAQPRLETAGSVPVTKSDNSRWQPWLSDAAAILHDLGHYARRALQPLTNPTARLAYSIVALVVFTASLGTAAVIGVQTLHHYGPELSNPAIMLNEKDVGTTILDRNGMVLYRGYGAVDRQDVPLSQVSNSLKEATVATEDPNFYHDSGVSLRGTARAAYQDAIHSDTGQGGSTITQQLVKNTLLSSEKSFTRKYKEVVLAMAMGQRYSKDQILQMYLNTIYYGQGAYGIQAASETYFHKPANQLTLNESATLAGLPQSPNQFDPTLDPKAAQQRRNYVLSRMQQEGDISTTTAARTAAEPITANPRQIDIKAPHFVFYVLDQLQQQYGTDMVEYGGITVHTTLDYNQQVQAQQIVANQVNSLSSHHVTNGGMISLDPHNGDILTMVGSVNYNQPGWGAVNTMLSQLQPGSSFKPIAYAEAFLKGWSGATQVQDEPLCWPIAGQAPYCPQDYSQTWSGPVLLRHSLGNSLNIPALQVLAHAGLADTIALGHAMGIQAPSLTGDPSQYGLPLVLGAGDVRPIDMAAVYATFDEGGQTVVPRAILSVTDKYGKDITKPSANSGGKQVLDPRIAYMITNILSDNQARQPEFGLNNPLVLDRPAAAKTGTTNDFDDNWTDGYTPNLVAVVWVGNNDHTPMENVSGISGAAPIWHDYMEMASAGTPAQPFSVPAGVVSAKICPSDGGLDTNPNDPSAINEVFLAGQAPTKPCGSYGPQPLPAGAYTTGRAQIAPATVPTVPAAPTTAPATAPAVEPTTTTTTTTTTPGQGSGSGGGAGPGGSTPGSGGGSGTPTPPTTTPHP